ncbi:porin [Polynucleobacter paneuropaeus]|nr:porin [Polynucleobacter paneuropaeus]
MKKSLFALAAVSALASTAQAQSSVTVYGILDVGYIGSNSAITASNSASSPNYTSTSAYQNSVLRQNNSFLGQSAEQTSRLGFKGSEDLGGGKSAFFTIETGLTPNSTNFSGVNNRQTFVGLKQNGLGNVSVGTQYQPMHNAVALTDPGMQNNMIGSVIYTGGSDSGFAGYGNQTNANSSAYQSRFSNTIALNSDTMAGFTVHAFGVLNNANSTAISNSSGNIATGGNVNSNGWALGVDYSWNKLFATANYSAIKQLTSITNQTNLGNTTGATAGTTNDGAWAIWTGAQAATNVQDNTTYVATTYDFGILKAYANWISRKATDTANSSYYQKRQAEQIGVRSFVTPTVEAWASAGVGTFTPYGNNQNSAHFNAWQLGSNYWLSKRTNLYAIYGQFAQSNAQYSATSVSGTTTTGNYAANQNSYAIGARHTF